MVTIDAAFSGGFFIEARMQVVKRNGKIEEFNINKVMAAAKFAQGKLNVDVEKVVEEAVAQLYPGVKTSEVQKALILTARTKIVKDPDYSRYAASLLLQELYHEAFGCKFDANSFDAVYRNKFEENLRLLVDAKRIDPRLLEKFDLDRLANALVIERDLKFKYLGIQTLYDRYFIHIDGRRMELPQSFWMRVAMGIALNETDPTGKAIEFYNLISQFSYCPSTPTLFNSGTLHSQMSSCYLSTMEDSLDGIYGTLHEQARLSKYAGGLGVDVTPLRASGSRIRGTNGTGSGIIGWLKQYNNMCSNVDQGSKRKGAMCLYLEPWHADFPEYLDIRKNTGDERRRCHDVNFAAWIPSLFMERVEADASWWLLCPDEHPKLHDAWGDEFCREYAIAEAKAEAGLCRVATKVSAKDLWKKVLKSIYETGFPFLAFKDTANARYTDKHMGVIHSANLCMEYLRHTIATKWQDGEIVKHGETAVCNLGSVNLAEHLILVDGNWVIDYVKLAKTVHASVRMLDAVINLNYYPSKPSKNSNLRHRPIGLGQMGYGSVLHAWGIAPDSQEAVDFAGRITEFISREAILASSMLAKEFGKYETYSGSDWDKGILPVDSYNEFVTKRPGGEPVACEFDWAPVRKHVAEHGVRNASILAIAPTATISFIMGCEQSIEPDYSALYVYSTLSGDFTMINEHLVNKLKARALWNDRVSRALVEADGDVSLLPNIPPEIKEEFKTAHNCDQFRLIDATAKRQIWIDLGISHNSYFAGDSLKWLNDHYMHAHKSGLKTTYYLRNKAASKVEKASTSEIAVESPKVCSILNPECESCQ